MYCENIKLQQNGRPMFNKGVYTISIEYIEGNEKIKCVYTYIDEWIFAVRILHVLRLRDRDRNIYLWVYCERFDCIYIHTNIYIHVYICMRGWNLWRKRKKIYKAQGLKAPPVCWYCHEGLRSLFDPARIYHRPRYVANKLYIFW